MASFPFIICLHHVLRMSKDLMKENGFTLQNKQTTCRLYPTETIIDADDADDLVESLQHIL